MEAEDRKKVPEVVSLVALGASKVDFINEVITTGNTRGVADEVWVINKLGVLFKHDMLFRMDDMRTKYACNMKEYKGGNTADEAKVIHDTYNEWLKNHDKPIITSVAYPEFPTAVSYPLEKVINCIGYSYLRTTPAYAVAFAIYLGVKQLRIYGCDYNYPTDKYRAESGRANMEFIISIAAQRGIDIFVAPKSTLLDTSTPPAEMMYGYANPVNVTPDPDDKDKWKVEILPDVGKKIRNKQALREKGHLQTLMLKYKDEVVHDLISDGWITKKDIDKVEANKTKTLLDAPQYEAVQDESLKGE